MPILSSSVELRSLSGSLDQSPEDIFNSGLGAIFSDDAPVMHGDPDTVVIYKSQKYGPLEFQMADPHGEEVRTKFAHHLWNAGILMAKFIEGASTAQTNDRSGDECKIGTNEMGRLDPEEYRWSSLTGAKEMPWDVRGKEVIELGSGLL